MSIGGWGSHNLKEPGSCGVVTMMSTKPCPPLKLPVAQTLNNRRAFLTVRRLQESKLCCYRMDPFVPPSDTPSTAVSLRTDRREAVAWLATVLGTIVTLETVPEARAIGFKKELKKKKIPVEDYSGLENGLRIYDLAVGSGNEVHTGDLVTVHFDCLFRGIDVVSSRSARLLGGNRVVAEPLQFIVGSRVTAGGLRGTAVAADVESGGGLFSGASGPKPPPALSTAVIGMKSGGKRSVLVPPELGYGDEGEQEIGPGQSFELQIEVLSIEKSGADKVE